MNEEQTLKFFIEMQRSLAELNANMRSTLEELTNHETRITSLETKKQDDFKTQLLMLLAKAVVISVVSIGALTGASGMIAKVLNVS